MISQFHSHFRRFIGINASITSPIIRQSCKVRGQSGDCSADPANGMLPSTPIHSAIIFRVGGHATRSQLRATAGFIHKLQSFHVGSRNGQWRISRFFNGLLITLRDSGVIHRADCYVTQLRVYASVRDTGLLRCKGIQTDETFERKPPCASSIELYFTITL